MSHFSRNLEAQLGKQGLSAYRLAKLSEIHEQHLYKITRGERRPTDDVLARLASVAELDVSFPTLLGWRALDDYPPEALMQALITDMGEEALKEAFKQILGE